MSSTVLSVVTPNYNHGHLIGRAIEAVVSQSRHPDEYLILDDASTDNSLEIIDRYASKYSVIRVLRNKRNLGVLGCAKRLLAEASGDYVYCGSADDYVLPGFFESAMEMADRYGQLGIIMGQATQVDERGQEIKTIGIPEWSEPVHLTPERYLRDFFDVKHPGIGGGSSTVYKRSALLDAGGFRPELLSFADTFAARAIGLKHGACYISAPCAAIYRSGDTFSGQTSMNPKRNLDIMARAAWLMRSDEFSDRFPEASVRSWERRYRENIVGHYEKELRASIGSLAGIYGKSCSDGSNEQRVFRRCLKALLKVPIWWSKKRLQRYQGDVSCYSGVDAEPGT